MENNKIEVDVLSLYYCEPVIIGGIKINQPTVYDIKKYGEKSIYKVANIFCGNAATNKITLWDIGIDWTTIPDIEVFSYFIKTLEKEETEIFFGDIEWKEFELFKYKENEEYKFFLFNEKQGITIEEDIYLKIREHMRYMFNIFPLKEKKPKGRATKEAIIDIEKQELEKNLRESDSNKSTLLPLISSCCNHPGFKYKKNELKEIGIYEFMDSVQRLQIYESTIALNHGMYSGMVDLSGVNKNEFNFMRDIKHIENTEIQNTKRNEEIVNENKNDFSKIKEKIQNLQFV